MNSSCPMIEHTTKYEIHIINKAAFTIAPVVPNLYISPSSIIPSTTHFTVTDLKDSLLTLLMLPLKIFLFFIWMDPFIKPPQQPTCTILPQRFWDSLLIFGKALSNYLGLLSLQPSTLLQYVELSPSVYPFCNAESIG